MKNVRYITDISRLEHLTEEEQTRLSPVCDSFRFRANDYYLSLIDWSNPDDPIRKIIIPQVDETIEFGHRDASNEKRNYVAPGVQHKYPHTALLLCTEICGGYCRFCFRKRLFMDSDTPEISAESLDNREITVDTTAGIDYIARTPEITNVLLTGGDPLILSTDRLATILEQLRRIDHVKIIRIGTKMTAFNPYRIIDDPRLVQILARYSRPGKRIYLMTHFDAPEEITKPACRAVDIILKAGVIISNQTPLLRGINADSQRLGRLLQKLSFIGATPYYVFQCRPTVGNQPYVVPLVEGYRIVENAKKIVSGLAKRMRFVMSHERGKIEIAAVTDDKIYLKFHRARDPRDEGRFMICHRNDRARWFDDLIPADRTPVRANRVGLDSLDRLM